MTFDRLIDIDRLKEAGVDEQVARAHAEALRDGLFETVATKQDVRELGATLESKIDATARDLRTEIREIGVSSDGTITTLERKFNTLDRKFDTLDRKIEITARDLIIKGAGGLIAIAGIMIGLKLLG